jgi:signal transduction histidine kinase
VIDRPPRAARALALAMLAWSVGTGTSGASCKTPLPSLELRPLDESADADPARAIAGARSTLTATAADDALTRAQLYAIVADAYDTVSDDDGARAAVAAGRASLAGRPRTAPVESLLLRFALVEADTAETREAAEEAVRTLGAWERRLAPGSLGHACLLLVRGRVQGRVSQHERAAKDGLEAYRLTVQLGASDARAEAAYQLGTTFRRAGLYAEALQMADEVIGYTRARHQGAALANALFTRAQILEDAGRPAEALVAVDESDRLSREIGDRLGLAFGALVRCRSTAALGRTEQAFAACREARQAFVDGGRPDQANGALAMLAGLELGRGRPTEALTLVGQALADERSVPPLYLPDLWRVRAQVLERLGRTGEALEALKRSSALAAADEERRRSLAVAVLNAQQQAERLERDRQLLAHELQLERERAQARDHARHLAIGAAAAALVAALLLGGLLLLSRRHARELRRQEAIVRQTSENAPDALVLLDADGRTRFANRAPFGGAVPEPGRAFVEAVPADVRPAVAAALAELLGQRRAVSLDVALPEDAGVRRYEVRGQPVVVDGRLLGATLRASDATERRSLEREVLDAAARERERFSGELHEGLGQELTGVSLQLRAIATAARRGREDTATMVDDAILQVDHAIAATRDLARGLSPVRIERGSLSTALARLGADASRRLKATVTWHCEPAEVHAPESVADQLYRIADEAIADLAGRVGGTIELELTAGPEAYVLAIGSDEAPETARDDRLGARMIGYRARLLDGSVAVEPREGGGSRLVVRVPRTGDG